MFNPEGLNVVVSVSNDPLTIRWCFPESCIHVSSSGIVWWVRNASRLLRTVEKLVAVGLMLGLCTGTT